MADMFEATRDRLQDADRVVSVLVWRFVASDEVGGDREEQEDKGVAHDGDVEEGSGAVWITPGEPLEEVSDGIEGCCARNWVSVSNIGNHKEERKQRDLPNKPMIPNAASLVAYFRFLSVLIMTLYAAALVSNRLWIPKRPGIWEEAMVTAEPVMNPATAGVGMNSTIQPIRKRPIPRVIKPQMKESVTAICGEDQRSVP